MRAHEGEAGAAEAAATGWAEAGVAAGAVGATLGAGAFATLGVGEASSGFSPLQPKTKPPKSAAAACHLDPNIFMPGAFWREPGAKSSLDWLSAARIR